MYARGFKLVQSCVSQDSILTVVSKLKDFASVSRPRNSFRILAHVAVRLAWGLHDPRAYLFEFEFEPLGSLRDTFDVRVRLYHFLALVVHFYSNSNFII